MLKQITTLPSFILVCIKFNEKINCLLWRRKWQPAPVFLPGKSHGQRSIEGYSPWGHRVDYSQATKQQQEKLLTKFSKLQIISYKSIIRGKDTK